MVELPSELIRQILQWLRLSSRIDHTANFTTALRVCSKWGDIGERLLWTGVSLENDRIDRFLSGGGRRDAFITSLTLLIRPLHFQWPEEVVINDPDLDIGKESPATNTLWKSLEKLPDRVRHMKSLTSFSFKVSGYTLRHQAEGFWLRTEHISAIIDALPASVKHLEIDSYCFDRRGTPSVTGAHHLCPRLRRMLPQLNNLRLRLSQICEELVESQREPSAAESSEICASVLVTKGPTVTVNTCDLLSQSSTRSCASSKEEGPDAWGDERACRKVIEDLLERLIKGIRIVEELRFGSIAFVETFNTPMEAPVARKPYAAVIKRSLFPAKLARYPYEIIGWNPDSAFLRLRDAKGQDTEICGCLHDLVDEVESHPWVETDEGHRMPGSLFREELRFKEVPLKQKEILSHEAYVYTGWGASDLWFQEQHNGRLLLRMVECENIYAVGCVEREKTDAEIRRTQEGMDMSMA